MLPRISCRSLLSIVPVKREDCMPKGSQWKVPSLEANSPPLLPLVRPSEAELQDSQSAFCFAQLSSANTLLQIRILALLYSIHAAPFCTRTASTISNLNGTVLPRRSFVPLHTKQWSRSFWNAGLQSGGSSSLLTSFAAEPPTPLLSIASTSQPGGRLLLMARAAWLFTAEAQVRAEASVSARACRVTRWFRMCSVSVFPSTATSSS
mmetsp:Transcript_78032/g.187089  ORF Transcript_78032/g.187089 Transcript_78032/m.187089 type:complete len:207 (-) Transcript_78032:95-715(-)